MNKMNKIISLVAVALSLLVVSSLVASDDYYEKGYYKKGYSKKGYSKKSKYQVKPATNQLYIDECASCHFGYQAGLLPSKSWKKLMKPDELANHFNDDATLEEEDRIVLLDYLVKNASDTGGRSRVGDKIAKSIFWGSTPIAISETRYFKKEHDEVPQRLITQKEVKSIANCAACHTTAEKGYYGERDIMIPNYGRWDD